MFIISRLLVDVLSICLFEPSEGGVKIPRCVFSSSCSRERSRVGEVAAAAETISLQQDTRYPLIRGVSEYELILAKNLARVHQQRKSFI